MMDSDYTMDTSSIQVTLTCREHEIINNTLITAIDSLLMLCPSGWAELPDDSELKIYFEEIQQLQESFGVTWSQRFD